MNNWLNIFKSKRPVNSMSINDLELFFYFVKDNMMNPSTNKWLISKYKNFVIDNSLEFVICHKVLKELSETYVYKKNKGFIEFIMLTKKFNKIEVKNRVFITNDDKELFIDDLVDLKERYFKNITVVDFLSFIHSNFEINYTESSLRSFYYNRYGNSKK